MSPEIALLKDVQRTLRLQQVKHGNEQEAENVRSRVIERMAVLAVAAVLAASPAAGQEHRTHPAADMPLHERFYSTWNMPDEPTKSCCNKADCYPTEVRFVDGVPFARRREDGHWLRIPAKKIERRRDNPDGRNHLCAPPPNASYPADTVFCFSLGSGI